ncbi:hypothetical protein BS17DRAFT_800320 [Gyrodon lividus]|nr:hypothetical protein BS17DRAFT_800320 [Gyrodon lividus]
MSSSRFHEHLASELSADVEYPERVGKSDFHSRADIISQIREATSAPSPLTGYLKDPAVISALDGADSSRAKSQRHSSSTRSREPRHSSSILGLVLAEEEKQAHKLKSLLRSTGDRLDQEIRRANQAVARAEHAESRVHELTARVSKAESSKYLVELEAAREKEEIKRHKLQIESLEREVKRLQADVSLLEKQRNEADESAARGRDTARGFQMELRNLQAKEAGREEGRRFGMHKWFKTGRIEGWDAGHVEGLESGRNEGFEEGCEYGLAEGREVGLKQGRKIGRQEGFDEGWEQEIDERDHVIDSNLAHSLSCICINGRRKGKEIPRLPLSAFSPPNTGTSDTFPLPPTPSLVIPQGVVDSHLQVTIDSEGVYKADISHLDQGKQRGVVLTVKGQSADAIFSSPGALQSSVNDVRILSVLVPFALEDSIPSGVPSYLSATATPPATLATTYNGATPVAAEVEDDSKVQAQVEAPVKNLRWALKHSKVVDIDVAGGIMAADSSFYDSFVNLLTKATELENQSAEDSTANTKRTPIVLTNILPPPVDSNMLVVTMMNHPTYMTYRQRVSLLSLFENVHVKLLPPTWTSVESMPDTEEGKRKRDKEWKDILKLFIAPVLEAFGFERIIFGSSPATVSDVSAQPMSWYKLAQESFRELAVGQDEMNKVFMENAERVYGVSS